VDFGVALIAGSESPEVVQVSEAALHDPALAPESGAVRFSAACDEVLDPERSQQPPVLVVVIAAIGEQPVGLSAWPSDLAGDRPAVKVFQQRDQLCDVVALSTGQGNRKRNAAGVDEQVVL
jgi:hypothetical protein